MTIEVGKVAKGETGHVEVTEVSINASVEDVYSPLLEEVADFCANNGIDIAWFFKALWAVVVRQYITNGPPQFGFQDLRGEDYPRKCLNAIEVVQIPICGETTFASLLGSQRPQECQQVHRSNTPDHTTAVFLLDPGAEWEATAWLKKHADQKVRDAAAPRGKAHRSNDPKQEDYYHAVLVATVDDNILTRLQLFYSPAAFSSEAAAGFSSTLSRSIEEILARPSRRGETAGVERPHNLQENTVLNGGVRCMGMPASVSEVIEQHAVDYPDKPAVSAWDREFTYGQLDHTTRCLARHLRKLGVRQGMLVLMIVERSTLAVVAELAIIKAGGAFVPVDPLQPQQRLQSILEQTKSTMAVVSDQFSGRLSSSIQTVVAISHDILRELAKAEENRASLPPVAAKSTAYVLFTSGSTGQPKGCVMENAALADVRRHAEALNIRPQERVLQFASYTFGVSLIEIYCTLSMGAAICIPSENDRLNRLTDVVNEMQVTWAFLTPSTATSLDAPRCTTLRTLVTAGEPMGAHTFDTWTGRVDLYQGYGFTEWAGVCCVSPVRTKLDIKTIGRSPTATLWVADPTDHARLTPKADIGELLVEGPSLASGYLNDDSRTSLAFLENPPWLENTGGPRRVYKTGDLVQYRDDGTLRYVGRKDLQVKIRGHRVELGEVEHSLRMLCPWAGKVVAAAAIPKMDEKPLIAAFIYCDKYIIMEEHSVVVTHPTEEFRMDMKTVEEKMAAALPEYMRPSVYLPLSYIPMTITGKVDRQALQETLRSLTRRELMAYMLNEPKIVAPATALESQLHRMFAQILNLPSASFGIHDRFLQLGGDSIMAMRLVALARRQQCRLSVSMILKCQSISRLVEQLKDSKSRTTTDTKSNYDDGLSSQSSLSQYLPSENGPDSPLNQRLAMLGIPLHEVEDIYPCAPIQEGILLSQASNPQMYEMRFLWEITPAHGQYMDVGRLRTAWRKVCQHHFLLRSRFLENVVADHFAVQIVLKANIPDITVVHVPLTDPHQLLHRKEGDKCSRLGQPHLTVFAGTSGRIYTVLDISHVAVDAMSMAIIMEDLALFYDGLCPSPSRPYRDYIAYLSGRSKEAALSFWKSRLAGLDPCIFPLLRSKRRPSGAQQLRSVEIDTTRLPAYRAFCQERQITLVTLFKIAWGLVLRCFTGNDDICFGYMTAGRDIPLDGIERTVGPFINLLVCRIQFTPDSSLLRMAQSVQEEFIEDIRHQNVSFADIRHVMRLGDEKLFNTAMTFPPNAMPEGGVDAKANSITVSEVARLDPTEYDIMVEVDAQGSKTECKMKYQTDFLSDEQARHLSNTLTIALAHIIQHSHSSVSDVDLFHRGDETRVAEWNRQEPEAVDQCVHHLIQQRCRAHPASLAVDAWDGRWTYGELDELSSALAQQLQTMGVAPDVLVPLCFDKSRWVPIALLAVMKAGGAFCLLDPSHPVPRLQAICQQLKGSIVLTSSEQCSIACQLCETVVVVGDKMECLKTAKRHPAVADHRIQPTPSSALYVVFTSGSTGTPKGIVVEHRSLASTGQAAIHATSLTPEDRVMQFSSYAFDVSVSDHIVCFISGACLCIPSEYDRQNRLAEVANEFRVTWAMMTPSMARALQSSQLPSLRTLMLIGEPVLASDIKAWASPDIRLFNTYGPAESAVLVTSHPCTDAALDSGIIGKGLRAVGTWIVDPTNSERLMPVGAVGELVLEGPAVARGYLHNNCSRIPPFGRAPRYLSRFRQAASQDRRVYQTGDLVRYTPEGYLEYLGRKDTQIKIRGQRVELGEIESTISTFFDGTADAVADVVKLGHGHVADTVVAFILVHSSTGTGTGSVKEETDKGQAGQEGKGRLFSVPGECVRSCFAELWTFLRLALPKYMVPAMFIPLTRLPVTRSGKADRKVLQQELAKLSPEDLNVFNYSQAAHRAPKTAKELQLQDLFAQVLRLPRDKVWADSDFFLLGGDSIAAMNLVTAARNASPNLWLAVADIFSHPQLAELADISRLEEENSSRAYAPFSLLPPSDAHSIRSAAAEQCQIPSSEIEDIYPCTPLQEGLCALTAQQTGLYTAQSGFMIPENVDISLLQAAWASTVAANPILRTRIISTEKHGLLQVAIRHDGGNPIDWRVGDSLEAYLEQDLATPMGPGNALVRFALVRHATCTHLLLTMHHALYDGRSTPLLLQQVKDAYYGQQLVTRPFAPFVQYLQSTNGDEARQFWMSEFNGLDAAIYPSLQAGILTPSPDSQVKHEITVSVQTGAGGTLSNLIRLAWAILLAQYTDNRDVVYGVTVSGRNAAVPGIEHLTGPTIATVPFRVLLDESVSVSAAASSIQQHATRMIPFEQTGLQHIRAINADTASACAFQSYLAVLAPDEKDGGSAIMMPQTEYGKAAAFSSYALALICQLPEASTGGTIHASANFDSRLLSAAEAERLIVQFGHVLQQVCLHPTRRISHLDIVGPADMMQLQCWNAHLPKAYCATVHESVLAHAQLSPHALAVSSWDRNLTYEQLDSLSAGLALQLLQLGVKRGDFVPLCFERSTWPMVAMLAVLRVGGVCVNVDPGFPEARIQHMLEDTKPRVILVSTEKEQLMATASRSFRQTIIHVVTKDSTPMLGLDQSRTFDWTPIQVQPQDLAFVFFTSGSTGAPKGIVMTHQNLMTTIYHHIDNVNSTTRALQFASHAFDMCISEIFKPLTSGGSTFIASQEQRMSDLSGYIRRHNLNWACLTPSTATVLEPTEVPILRTMVLGGEVVTQDHVNTWASRLTLINGYGPTETSVCVISGEIRVDAWRPGTLGLARGAVGWVTCPTDPTRLMPPGAIGELLIEGPLLTRGYLNRPDKTREAFIDPPAWLRRFRRPTSPGQLYRTGDLVRLTPDGQFQFLGRRDTQVKLRGQRLELAEIETHIRQQFPGDTTVAAEVIRGVNKSALLVAFLHCETDNQQVSDHGRASKADSPVASLSAEFRSSALAVRERLQELLPSYMVPAALIPLSFVPSTASGKVDRQRLRRAVEGLTADQLDLYMSAGAQTSADEAVETKAEEILRDLWARVLGIPSERIDRNHQFFHLGGESIAAMKLAAATRRQGLELSVTQIFAQPRLADMAILLGELPSDSASYVAEGERWQELSPIQQPFSQVSLTDAQVDRLNREIVPKCGPVEDIYPCTPAQRGILLSQLRNPEEYQVRIRFEAIAAPDQPAIDAERVKEAWAQVVHRHAALRTILLPLSDGGMVDQLVLKDFCPHIPIETVASSDLASVSSSIPDQHPNQLTTKAVIRRTLDDRVFLDLSINHVFLDGDSISILWRDLTLAYDNRLPNGERPSYGDYVAHLSRSPIAPARNYWSQYTKGLEPCLMPPMIQEADAAENGVATVELGYSTAALDRFCAEHSVSLTTLGQVAWALVLRCYTAMDDICFGYALSARGQPVPRIQDAVGLLVNMLLSRIQLPAERTVASVLNAHQEQFVQHLSHQYHHIGDMELAQRPTEMFNTCFQIHRVPPSTSGSIAWKIHRNPDPTEYPILGTLGLFERRATFEIAYRRSFASPDQGIAIGQAFREVLTAIVRDPTQAVGNIDLLSSDGRNQLASLNEHRLQEPAECVHWAIQARCASTPAAPAVCSWDGTMTYRELDSRASILARDLVQQGVGPEQFVPLCLEKCQWVPVAVLAVLKAGAAFVLLDPSLPRQRLQANCEDLGVRTIITTSAHQKLAATLGQQVITISSADDRWSRTVSESYSVSTVRPDNVAYAVFTSGSTGRPKATVMEHRAICANHAGQNSVCPFEPSTRHFAFSSHAFDISVDELLSPMMAGACVCIPSETDRVSRLAEVAAELQVTRASLASSVARVITPQEIPTMKTMVIGGETPTNIEVSAWSSITLVFDYSPAECGAFSVARVCERPVKDTANIGKPTSSARVWIVDQRDHTRLVPFGAVGEMVIEGPSVSRGYLGLPDKTRESFIEAPAWRRNLPVDGLWRMYKTGDLAQYQADGSIRFLGRRDTQVKLRGQRIELGEVEFHTKAAFPRSEEVVAEVVKPVGTSRPPVLVAFILQSAVSAFDDASAASKSALAAPSPGFRSDIRHALPRLRKALPRYMVPTVFFPLQRLPRSPTGKIHRLALRREAASLTSAEMKGHSVAQVTYRPPSTLTEGRLATLAANVLQVPLDRVSVDGDLFEMGLDSIRAMTLVGLARKEHGLPLTVANVLAHPRIAALAQLIQPVEEIGKHDSTRSEQPRDPLGTLLMATLYDKHLDDLTTNYPFARDDIENILPTTQFQRDFLRTDHRYYFVLRLPGSLDEVKLRSALSAVVQKQSILRTLFVPFHDTFLQVVLRQIALPWLSQSVDDVSAAVDTFCSEDSRTAISPGTPYLQLRLIRNRHNDREHAWILRSTHAQLDGVCLPRLIKELTATYNGVPLEPAPTFTDFMAKRAQHHTSALFDYWRELLDGASMTYLNKPLSSSSSNNAIVSPAPSAEIVQQTRQITSAPIPAPFTTATVHKAAWALVLARRTQTRDIVFGQVVNGRSLPMDGISDVLGPCVNHIPVRVRLQPESTVQDLLQQIQNQHVQSMEFDTVDMCEIVARSTSWPAGTYFGSATQHQNIPVMAADPFAGVLAHFEARVSNAVPRMPHVVSVPRGDDGLELVLWADSREVSAEMADELLREFAEVFVRLASDVEGCVGDLL
ncbi:hypothetical protein CNMCM5793_004734 [Aspergillus hiratsukae]|uniref:Carrier domain-containing protein n=1 Tax=Aspergillus hiratsukae TaxID=1194566 RepID=A0A8H6UZT6_9EURO|nr:hypothetical protein CNMCM5793_004734 [Aspergillus hiratsukae]KAF7170234.1 hypothetical protein CNMCM6106_005012 [Aspergillus hiratsukae]